MIEIESNIVMPRAAGNPSKSLYPFKGMDVGDSFFMETKDKRVIMRRIRSAIAHYTKFANADKKFATRSVDGGVRCWRIE